MAIDNRVTDPDLIKRLNALSNPEASGVAELDLGITEPMSSEEMQKRLAERTSPVSDPDTLAVLNEEVQTQESWYEDPLNAARMVVDGMWFGWSEEVGAGIAAGLVKMLGMYGSERPYAEIYNEMVSDIRAERDAYEEKHETASTLLNLAGGLASPANVAGAGVIGRAGQGRRLVSGMGVGATEGAIIGAGAAEAGDTLEGAKTGALLGATVPLALTGGRKLIDAATSRKITEELGEGADFIPLPLAASGQEGKYVGLISSFYKDIVGKSFGGASLISQQSKRFVNTLKEDIGKTKEDIDSLVNKSKSLLSEAKKANSADLNASKVAVKALKETKTSLKNEVTKRFQAEKELINAVKTQQLDATTNAAEEAFRRRAIYNSIPSGIDKKAVDEILNTKDLQKVNTLLDEQWNKNSFRMVKDKKFRVNPQQITDKLNVLLQDDIMIANGLTGTAATNSAANFTEALLDQYTTKGGWIDGQKLSALRSALGRSASLIGDKDVVQTRMLREFQNVLNDSIEAQLKGPSKKAFQEQREQWATFSILKDATVKASTEAGKRGQFTAQDWLNASKMGRENLLRKGSVKLQDEANKTAERVQQRDNHLIEVADAQLKKKQQLAEAEIAGIENRTKQSIRNLEANSKKLSNTAADSAEYKAIQQELSEKKAALQLLKERKETFSEMLPKGQQSIFEKLAATSALALNPFGMTSLPVGLVVGRVLASPTAQRNFAGQANWQKGMQNITKMLTEPPTQVPYGASRVDIPLRATARTGAMEMAEDIGVSSQELNALGDSGGNAQAQAYYKFYQTGKLEEIKKKNKKVYDQLRASYEKTTGNTLE